MASTSLSLSQDLPESVNMLLQLPGISMRKRPPMSVVAVYDLGSLQYWLEGQQRSGERTFV